MKKFVVRVVREDEAFVTIAARSQEDAENLAQDLLNLSDEPQNWDWCGVSENVTGSEDTTEDAVTDYHAEYRGDEMVGALETDIDKDSIIGR